MAVSTIAAASENILIEDDAAFERYRRQGVVTGSGGPGDPYVIAGRKLFSGLDLSRPAIRIANTQKSFVIRGNTIWGGSVGIQIENARNGVVENNEISGSPTRFRRFVHALVRSRFRIGNRIEMKGMSTGIELVRAGNISVKGNTVRKIVGLASRYRGSRANHGVGIRLRESRNVTLAENNIRGVAGGVGRAGLPNLLGRLAAGMLDGHGGGAGSAAGVEIDRSQSVKLRKNNINFIFGGAGGAGGAGTLSMVGKGGGEGGGGGSSYGVVMSRSTGIRLASNRIERIFGGAGAAGAAGAASFGLGGGGGGQGGTGGNAHAIVASGCRAVLLHSNAIVKVMAGAGGSGAAGGFPSGPGGRTGRGGKAFGALFSGTTGVRTSGNTVERVLGGAGAGGTVGGAGIGLLGGASGRPGGQAGAAFGFAFLRSRDIKNAGNRFQTLRGAAGGAGGAGSAGFGPAGGNGGRGGDGGSAAGLFFFHSHEITNRKNTGKNIVGGRGAAGAAGATALVYSGDGGHAGRGGHAALIWTMGSSTKMTNLDNRGDVVAGGRGGSGGAGAIDAVWNLDFGRGGRVGAGGRAAGLLITPRGAQGRLQRMKKQGWGITRNSGNIVKRRQHGTPGLMNGFGDGLKKPRPPRKTITDWTFQYRARATVGPGTFRTGVRVRQQHR
jgi:parallel beta-helix repeat protein